MTKKFIKKNWTKLKVWTKEITWIGQKRDKVEQIAKKKIEARFWPSKFCNFFCDNSVGKEIRLFWWIVKLCDETIDWCYSLSIDDLSPLSYFY